MIEKAEKCRNISLPSWLSQELFGYKRRAALDRIDFPEMRVLIFSSKHRNEWMRLLLALLQYLVRVLRYMVFCISSFLTFRSPSSIKMAHRHRWEGIYRLYELTREFVRCTKINDTEEESPKRRGPARADRFYTNMCCNVTFLSRYTFSPSLPLSPSSSIFSFFSQNLCAFYTCRSRRGFPSVRNSTSTLKAAHASRYHLNTHGPSYVKKRRVNSKLERYRSPLESIEAPSSTIGSFVRDTDRLFRLARGSRHRGDRVSWRFQARKVIGRFWEIQRWISLRMTRETSYVVRLEFVSVCVVRKLTHDEFWPSENYVYKENAYN